ncbi:MAG: hypothetical protein R3A48_16785 [Polyangiales bacterium]
METSSEPGVLVVVLIAAGFPILFVGIWSLVCLTLSAASGWRSMRAAYPAPEGLRGAPLPSGFACAIGGVSYRGTTSFEATPQGLLARVMVIFPFHPPLLIPWSALRLTPTGSAFFAGEMQVAHGATFRLNADALASIGAAQAQALNPAPAWGGPR